jgi:hypothetical protein
MTHINFSKVLYDFFFSVFQVGEALAYGILIVIFIAWGIKHLIEFGRYLL